MICIDMKRDRRNVIIRDYALRRIIPQLNNSEMFKVRFGNNKLVSNTHRTTLRDDGFYIYKSHNKFGIIGLYHVVSSNGSSNDSLVLITKNIRSKRQKYFTSDGIKYRIAPNGLYVELEEAQPNQYIVCAASMTNESIGIVYNNFIRRIRFKIHSESNGYNSYVMIHDKTNNKRFIVVSVGDYSHSPIFKSPIPRIKSVHTFQYISGQSNKGYINSRGIHVNGYGKYCGVF